MTVQRLTRYGIGRVLRRLRESDQREMAASIGDDPGAVGLMLWNLTGGLRWEALDKNGHALMIGGVTQVWPGLGAAWAYCAVGYERVIGEVTREVRREILPTLDAMGFHRIEARPMEANLMSCRWLETLGFERQTALAQFGRGRETFVLYARYAPLPAIERDTKRALPDSQAA